MSEFKNTVTEIQEDVLSQRIEIAELKEKNKILEKDLQTAIETNRLWLKRDTSLEAQIEKMKCCGNCKHFWSRENGEIGKCNNPTQKECTLGTMDKWELAE